MPRIHAGKGPRCTQQQAMLGASSPAIRRLRAAARPRCNVDRRIMPARKKQPTTHDPATWHAPRPSLWSALAPDSAAIEGVRVRQPLGAAVRQTGASWRRPLSDSLEPGTLDSWVGSLQGEEKGPRAHDDIALLRRNSVPAKPPCAPFSRQPLASTSASNSVRSLPQAPAGALPTLARPRTGSRRCACCGARGGCNTQKGSSHRGSRSITNGCQYAFCACAPASSGQGGAPCQSPFTCRATYGAPWSDRRGPRQRWPNVAFSRIGPSAATLA